MKKHITLAVPMGYQLVDKTEEMKIWQAETILLSRRGRRYTKAVRRGEEAVLQTRYLTCPYCGKAFVANANETILPGIGAWELPQAPSGERIRRWADLQLSLFEGEDQLLLPLAPPLEPGAPFTCPACQETSRHSKATRAVTLTADRKKIRLTTEIRELPELLNLQWLKQRELAIRFPIYEVLTFDLGRGRVYVRVEDMSRTVLGQRDITDDPGTLKGGATEKAFSHKVVKRNLKRLFAQLWGSSLPYGGQQIDLASLFEMTRFIGYPRGFYACIPYCHGTRQLDRSFARQVKLLHRAQDLPAIYQRLDLPQAKSARRLLFSNPGIFFYMEELRRMWGVLGDINFYCRFLAEPAAFEALTALHARPGAFDYLQDYAHVRDGGELVARMHRNWCLVQREAADYSCMSPQMRARTRQLWKNAESEEDDRDLTYSMPHARPDAAVEDCTVRGYSFFWLRSSNDYAAAAKGLKNCLGSWQWYDYPVVCVKRNGKYVAAIEVRDGCVTQARGYDNAPLTETPRLLAAVVCWMNRFGLRMDTEEGPEDYPEHLRDRIQFAGGNLPF